MDEETKNINEEAEDEVKEPEADAEAKEPEKPKKEKKSLKKELEKAEAERDGYLDALKREAAAKEGGAFAARGQMGF